MALSERFDYQRGAQTCLNNIGVIYKNQGDYTIAGKHHLQALKIGEEIHDEESIAVCFNNLGIVYDHQGNYERALIYHPKVSRSFEELIDADGNPSGTKVQLTIQIN